MLASGAARVNLFLAEPACSWIDRFLPKLQQLGLMLLTYKSMLMFT